MENEASPGLNYLSCQIGEISAVGANTWRYLEAVIYQAVGTSSRRGAIVVGAWLRLLDRRRGSGRGTRGGMRKGGSCRESMAARLRVGDKLHLLLGG